VKNAEPEKPLSIVDDNIKTGLKVEYDSVD
jgi:hypothetical protein